MKNFQFSIFNFQKGFTLIELMTALSIFIIVITISMGSILGIFDANRKSKSLKTVMSNLNLTLESMSKEMRYGTNYHCGSSGTIATSQNCPEGENFISFLSSDNVQTTYRLNGTTIEKQLDNAEFIPVTAPEVTIGNLTFYTLGAGTNNTLQSKTLIAVQGQAGTGKGHTDFALQTLVSQRALDVEETLAYATPYVYPTPPPVFYSLTVTKAGTGTGTVTGPSINCGSGSGCTSSYASGALVTLTAAAGSGAAFAGWSGACSGTGVCDLVMNSAKAVTATFSPSSYTVAYFAVGAGGGGSGEDGSTWPCGGGGSGGDVVNGSVAVSGGTNYGVTVGGIGAAGAYGAGSAGGSSVVFGQVASGGAGGEFASCYGGDGASHGGHYSGAGSGVIGIYNDWVSAAESAYYGSGGGSNGNSTTPNGGAAGNSSPGGVGWYGAGGGGGHCDFGSPDICSNTAYAGGYGNIGRVLIRYAGAPRGTGGTIVQYGGYTVHSFTSSGIFYP